MNYSDLSSSLDLQHCSQTKVSAKKKKWFEIWFIKQCVIAKSPKSLKLFFPRESQYRDYSFWISKKLLKNENCFILGEDFVIKAKKEEYQNGEFVKKDEIEFSAKEVNNLFTMYKENFLVEETIELIPNKLQPIKNPKPLDCLMRL